MKLGSPSKESILLSTTTEMPLMDLVPINAQYIQNKQDHRLFERTWIRNQTEMVWCEKIQFERLRVLRKSWKRRFELDCSWKIPGFQLSFPHSKRFWWSFNKFHFRIELSLQKIMFQFSNKWELQRSLDSINPLMMQADSPKMESNTLTCTLLMDLLHQVILWIDSSKLQKMRKEQLLCIAKQDWEELEHWLDHIVSKTSNSLLLISLGGLEFADQEVFSDHNNNTSAFPS